MIDLRRLRGLLTGLGLVSALALVLTLTALPPVLGAWMARLDRANRVSPLASYQMVGGRMASMVQEGRGVSRTAGDERFGITLGASQCLCAVDAAKLSAESTNPPTRWLPCAGLGVTPADTAQVTDLILRTPVRPDRVLIGIDSGMVARVKVQNFWFDEQVPPRLADVLDHAKGHPKQLAADLVQEAKYLKGHLLPYREAIHRHFPVELFDLRMKLFAPMGFSPHILFAPDSNPWNVDDPMDMKDVDEAENAKQLENQRAMGRFDPENYKIDGPNIKGLVEAVGRLKAAGAQVVILMLPEESRVRKLRPPEAMNVIRDSLSQAFGKEAPPILDLREAAGDDEFRDILHLNNKGRERVTKILASAIPPLP